MCVIPALRRWRQKDSLEFEVTLGYRMSSKSSRPTRGNPCLNKQSKIKVVFTSYGCGQREKKKQGFFDTLPSNFMVLGWYIGILRNSKRNRKNFLKISGKLQTKKLDH